MAFEGLTEKLTNAFNRLRGKGVLTEADVREAMREVKLALLEADVSFKVVKDFVNRVTERAVGTDVLKSLSPAQMVIKIVNEELTELMGGKAEGIQFAPKGPTVIMMVGLQGAGKTTNAAKLAGHFKRSGRRPLLVACDVYRPAAIQQLEVVGEQVGVPVFQMGQIDPVEIAKAAVDHARKHGNDMVFLDTAGRLHVDEALMDELKRVKAAVEPNEILLVVDAMIGQDAVNAASAFNDALDLTGVMLTKLDGDARGGAALSIKATIGKPIKFSGIGEKLDQIEVFHPDRMASRILGMGDMLSLIEKAEASYDEEQAAKLEEKLRKNRFTLADYYDQLLQLKKLGSLTDILGMLPGTKGQISEEDIDESVRTAAVIQSMTPAERDDPKLLNASRKKRIAAGSGTTVQQVNQVLKQFELMQAMTRQISGGKLPKGVRNLMGGSASGIPGLAGMGSGGGGGHSKGRTKPSKKRKKKR
jgi:signal recognition particle subunit SRP54